MEHNTYVRLRFILEEVEQLLSTMIGHQNWAAFSTEYNGWQSRIRAQQHMIESIRQTLLQEQADDVNSALDDALDAEADVMLKTIEDVRYRLALGYAQVDAFPRNSRWMTW